MLSRKQCLEKYGSDYFIRKEIDDGKLYRIAKGIYSEKDHVPEMVLVLHKHPDSVVTMRTAFYMHELTDVIPAEIDIATTRNAAKISGDNIRQYFVNDELFHEGIKKMDYKGYDISIYNKERMLIELLRYKTKLPFDYYKEIILNYRKIMPRLNIQKIQDYAFVAPKSGKIMELLRMEVF